MHEKKTGSGVTRRRVIQNAGGVMATLALPMRGHVLAQAPAAAAKSDYTGRLAAYMASAQKQDLPPRVLREAKHRILDTIAAVVSGAALDPGKAAIKFIRTQGGTPEATIATTNIVTSAINAALVNGMFAHADETDDFEPVTKAHPGSSVVPAALAVGERQGSSGLAFIKAVVLGYDLCCRFLMSLDPDHVRGTHRSAEGTSSTFGSSAAAASLAGLSELQMRFVISYAAQQVSGLWSWVGDEDHVEKAFDFAGMGARNGVTAAMMVQSGFTGVANVLDGQHNMFLAMSTQPRPGEIVAALGSRYWIEETAIKTFSVGYPIQSPLDAMLQLRRQHKLTADSVEHVLVRLPLDGANIVNSSAMPDVNLQYCVAVALIDGALSFKDSHSQERMAMSEVQAVMKRIELVGDKALMDPAAPRSGFVEVTTKDGRKVNHFTRHAPGTKENPLDTEGVNAKARDLMTPVLGAQKTEALINQLNALEQLDDVRKLRPLLSA